MMARQADNHDQTEALRVRLAEAEEMLLAIRHGEIDALVVEGVAGNQVYTLHSAEEPYRNLVEQMQEGAAVLTGRGNILYANARFAALVGEPLESVVGSPFDRFVNPADTAEFDALWVAGSGRCRAGLIGPGGVVLDVSFSLTTNGERRNLIVTDLSELLEAHNRRDRAEHDNRTKDDFLATLAHELRNPLNAIGMAVQVLEATHAAGDGAARAHDVIVRQVSHVTHLIEDLLDIERVVSGKMRLDRRSLDMCEVVRRTVATFAGDARLDRRIEVTTEPAWIDGDAGRIEQVLTNLLTNAVKSTPRGGVIRVALRADGADAVLSVEDSGLGISPSLLPFIFDMYVQADKTLDSARGGLGIGLALVRRLVEMHGGTVAASSDGEGKGSTFTVRLRRISDGGHDTRHLGHEPTSHAVPARAADRRQRRGTRDVADDARTRRPRGLPRRGRRRWPGVARCRPPRRGHHRPRAAQHRRLPDRQADPCGDCTADGCCCWRCQAAARLWTRTARWPTGSTTTS